MENQKKTVRFTIDLPHDMHRYLKIFCAENDERMGQLTAKALTEYLIKREHNGRKNRSSTP